MEQKIHIESRPFGKTKTNQEASLYSLKNSAGMEVNITDYGATITSLKIPLEKEVIDIVLGFDSVEDYEASFQETTPYFGCIVGRYAGRIKNGLFTLNHKIIQLNQNNNSNALHGGFKNFSNQIWKVINYTTTKNPSITLELLSPDGSENYPGNLICRITYTLSENNALELDYFAQTDQDTIVNLTNHTYFNLKSHKENLQDHMIIVPSDKVLQKDKNGIPTGNFLNIEDTPYNFKTYNMCPKVIDHSFVVKDNSQPVAKLICPLTQIKLTAYTDQPSVHLYVGGDCGNLKGKNNTTYTDFSGICLEMQNFPDAPNHNHFPNPFLRKDETYKQKTIFQFDFPKK